MKRILRRTLSWLKIRPRLWKDEFGGLLTYTALAAPILLGFAGLSVDISIWYANARQGQATVDSAAIAGALEVMRSNSDPTAVVAAATAEAANRGYSTSNGDGVTVNYPPTSGINKDAMDSVEVILARQSGGFFSQFLTDITPNVTSRAVGKDDFNDTCVWSLNQTKQSAIKIAGGAQVNLGCGIISNSVDSNALTTSGGGCLNATKIKVVGGASGGCLSSSPLTGVTAITDPLASIGPPSSYTEGVCDDSTNYSIGNGDSITLTPGTYCGKISISGGTLNFAPGIYNLDNAGFKVSGGTVTGTDVNFYLSKNNGQGDDISITGGTVNLTAAGSGDLPGILFYHDRNSPNAFHNFTGGTGMHVEGILYFPNQDIKFAGGSALDSSTSLIIADTVDFVGNADIGGFENTPILANPFLIEATLVE